MRRKSKSNKPVVKNEKFSISAPAVSMSETISDEREISAVKLAVVALNQAALVVLLWVV